MAITVVNVADNIKDELDDAALKVFGGSSDKLNRIVAAHAISQSQTYQFEKVATGYYKLVAALENPCIWVVGSTPFTETAAAYTYDAGTHIVPAVIYVATGTDARTSIDVTGTQVDFAQIMVATLLRIATKAAMTPDQQIEGYGMTGNDLASRCREQATHYQGYVSLS